MTDKTAHDVTDDDRRLARKWAEDIVTGLSNPRMRAAARVILNAAPAPPRQTLADMTVKERAACQWMQADVGVERRIIVRVMDVEEGVVTLVESGDTVVCPHSTVTPRPDLPRLEWPGDGPAPVPTLPDGWRLADHEDYGRGIVTNPTPNRDGRVYFVIPADDPMGYDWIFCTPDDLTYIDAGQKADDVPPVKVGDVIESADDPRLAALPVWSVLLDCDGDTVTKRSGAWVGLGYKPIESEGEELGPWTVRRIGQGAAQ